MPIAILLSLMAFGGYLFFATDLLAPPQKHEILMEVKGLEKYKLNHNGEEWDFFREVKPYNLVYVGFVNCPDVCPLTLSQTASAMSKLPGYKQSKIRVIFVSVDHEADTPDSVARYAKNFNEDFIGLTGTKEQISDFVGAIGAQYFKRETPKSSQVYNYAHSDRIFILDQQANLIATIYRAHNADQILGELKKIF